MLSLPTSLVTCVPLRPPHGSRTPHPTASRTHILIDIVFTAVVQGRSVSLSVQTRVCYQPKTNCWRSDTSSNQCHLFVLIYLVIACPLCSIIAYEIHIWRVAHVSVAGKRTFNASFSLSCSSSYERRLVRPQITRKKRKHAPKEPTNDPSAPNTFHESTRKNRDNRLTVLLVSPRFRWVNAPAPINRPIVSPWAHIRACTTFCVADWYLSRHMIPPATAKLSAHEPRIMLYSCRAAQSSNFSLVPSDAHWCSSAEV
jgi:hypothetical protein